VLRRCWPRLNRTVLLTPFEELLFSEGLGGGMTRGHERKRACVWKFDATMVGLSIAN
jgi:hypothetical protein